MRRREALRFRLGVFVTAVAVVLTLATALLLGLLRWQEHRDDLRDSARLAAFRLAEAETASVPALDLELDAGDEAFGLLLDDPPDTLARRGDLSPELVAELIDQVWQFTVDNGAAVSVELDDLDVVAAGAFCSDEAVCDTAIVGVRRGSTGAFLASRWAWIVAAPLLVGLATAAVTWWLVGRSLAPVHRMRSELDHITTTDLGRRVPVPASNDEIEALGRSMNATIERLGDAVAANERFVADAAHELRSPITGVRAALEVRASTDRDGLVVDSIAELDRAGRLVDDLLLLARRQGRPTRAVDVDVDDVARIEVNRARSRFPAIDVTARLQPARVTADPDDLRRVVANLVENACRHGGRHVRVRVGPTAGTVVLAVDDDGPGIAVEHREHVLRRFARLDASRSRHTGGSGLGLAIVDEVVTGLGGTTSIHDSDLGGASVRVELPLEALPRP